MSNVKTYSTKANARRAARTTLGKDAADGVGFNITEVGAGEWIWEAVEVAAAPATQEEPQAEEPVIGEFTHCPHCGVHLDNGYQTDDNLRADGLKGCMDFEYVCLACNEEFGPALVNGKEAKAKSTPVRAVNETSTVEKPTKRVWDIADEMVAKDPDVRRKDVIAECQARGVAFYTARTQYQLWFKARKDS